MKDICMYLSKLPLHIQLVCNYASDHQIIYFGKRITEVTLILRACN